MSSEDYGTESFETNKSSDLAVQRSMSDELMESMSFPCSEIEKEIEDEHYDEFKTQVEVLVQLGKKKLRPLELTDCYTTDRPGMFLDILPKIIFETTEDTSLEGIEFPKPIFRQTIDQTTLASVEYKCSSAQTLRSNLLNSWCQYEPRFFSEDDCSAVLNQESFSAFIKTAEKRIFKSLIQNKTADSFFCELKPLSKVDADSEERSELSLMIQAAFYCFECEDKQIIQSISWNSAQRDYFIASTLSSIKFEDRVQNMLNSPCDTFTSFVWSCKNQFVPKIYLGHFDDVTLHKFNPTLTNIIAGGTLNGLLVIWNLDQAEILSDVSVSYEGNTCKPPVLPHAVSSVLDHSHNRAIADLAWIPNHFEILTKGHVKSNATKESYQIATFGFDGILKVWDLRTPSKTGVSVAKMLRLLNGKWEPFHSVEVLPDERKYLSVTKFALKETFKNSKLGFPEEDNIKKKISTEFYAGCDNGEIFSGNFKVSRDDTGKFSSSPPQFFMSPHSGAVTSIAVSPFISDIFLSTGSRTVALWNHGIKTSPIYCKDMHADICSADWSITRPALFILGYEDGSIEMWDLHFSVYEPFLIHYVSTAFITAIATQMISEDEYLLSVGDSEGIAYTLVLPPYLWRPLDNELHFMREFVEKASSSIEVALQIIKSVGKDTETSEKEDIKNGTTDEIITEEVLQSNYQRFLEMQHNQLKFLGIIKVQAEEHD